MRSIRIHWFALAPIAALAISLPAPATAQSSRTVAYTSNGEVAADSVPEASRAAAARTTRRVFESKSDRREYEAARATADRATGFRIVVDIFGNQLYVIDGRDTLRTAPVATGSHKTLTFGGKSWHFETPRGVRKVLSKAEDPVWTPPLWNYVGVANEYGLKLRQLRRGERVRVRNGAILTTRGDEVGIIAPGSDTFTPLVVDEQIVFDSTLFVPPAGTKHRSIEGELGHYRLALGDGYMFHGTPDKGSVGNPVTHGCIRLLDDDIEWLYNNVPVGTKVYLY